MYASGQPLLIANLLWWHNELSSGCVWVWYGVGGILLADIKSPKLEVCLPTCLLA